MAEGCVFCNHEGLRELAEVYIENDWCVYASTRDPRDPPDVLPGCGVIVPRAHKTSPFSFSAEEWAATHELLLAAKAAWDERLSPDGYTLIWNCGSSGGQEVPHAHFHVIPRFDDEPRTGAGGRTAIKAPENRRPDPWAPGNGRARSLGPG
jgi:histidine triad (HIT) family protein